MIPMRSQILGLGASHEPIALWQPFVAYATKGCHMGFMVPMRDCEIVEAFHVYTFLGLNPSRLR